MIRIASFVAGFICLLALLVHFWIRAGDGDGVGMIGLTGTASVLLGMLAIGWRTRFWLRSFLFVASFAAFAVVVDFVAYTVWQHRVDRFVAGLQKHVNEGSPDIVQRMDLRPTYVRIEPGQGLRLTLEPPLLAWTYRLDAGSGRTHEALEACRRSLGRLLEGRRLDPVARTLLTSHQAYSVTVASSEDVLACREPRAGEAWMISVDSGASASSL